MILRKKALLFKVSDGLSPQDKMMGTDEFAVALQTMQAMPQIGAGFNIPPLFSYVMKLRGLDGLAKFEKSPLQLQWEQQLQIWQTTALEAIKKGLHLLRSQRCQQHCNKNYNRNKLVKQRKLMELLRSQMLELALDNSLSKLRELRELMECRRALT
jgi:hypothetical protein